MADHTEVAPPQAPASYDFNKLHDACVAGKSHAAAVKAALFAETLPEPGVDSPPVPAADEGDETVGLTKAELRDLLDARGVAYETDANLARLADLVRQNPAAAPVPGQAQA